MEHADALERIEIAAAEPDGLDRLMAGDTADAAAIAGHLAGCPACTAELARIRRTAAIARDVISTAPDPALRERTLAYVRAVGRDRRGSRQDPPPGAAASRRPRSPPPSSPPRRTRAPRPGADIHGGTALAGGVAGIAAALVLAVGLGFAAAAVQTRRPRARSARSARPAGRRPQRRSASPPSRTRERIALAADGRRGRRGRRTLLFSPVDRRAGRGRERPRAARAAARSTAAGWRWTASATRIGRMYVGGDLRSWAGRVDGLADLPADAVFGVSLGPCGRRDRRAGAHRGAAESRRALGPWLDRRCSWSPEAALAALDGLAARRSGPRTCRAARSPGSDDGTGARRSTRSVSMSGSLTVRAIQPASAVSSSSASSSSRRCESARTSQVRAPPRTTPTIRSHQLKSVPIGAVRMAAMRGCIEAEDNRPGRAVAAGLHSAAMPDPAARRSSCPRHRRDRVDSRPGRLPARADPGLLVRGLLRRRASPLAYFVITARRAGGGSTPGWSTTGSSSSAVAALIGGRLYHVIDQWALYQDDLRQDRHAAVHRARACTAGSSPGTIAAFVITALWKQSFWSGRTSSRPACSSCRPSAAGATSSTRSCTARRRTCRGASRSTAPIACAASTRCDGVPGGDDGLPPAVPVRVGQRDHRRDHAALDRPPLGPADAPGRPVPHLPHLVRGRPLRCSRRCGPATGRSSAIPTAIDRVDRRRRGLARRAR